MEISSAFLLNHTPGLFSAFHIVLSMLTLTAAYMLSAIRLNDPLKALETSARIALCTEAVKQVFLFSAHHAFQWWYFPFQLCSMPMYLLCCVTHLSAEHRETVCTFCASCSLIAALCALLYPENMLQEQAFLMAHSFLYHGWMLWCSFLIIRNRLYGERFLPACRLLIILAVIAEIINTIGFYSHTGYGVPDMFYISPFVPAAQPVFKAIADSFGRITEIFVYLSVFSLVSFLCLNIIRRIRDQ